MSTFFSIPAETETDHEFKTRMAAEGKAIYVPGKTAAESKAAREAEAARRAQLKPYSFELNEDQIDLLDTALPDACELITDAGQVFSFLVNGFVSGHIGPEDTGTHSIMRLAARALNGAETRELVALDMMDQKLRQARRINGEEA